MSNRAEMEQSMRFALEEATLAFEAGEVPVGAVLVRNGEVVAHAHNMVETLHDATAHAELLCLQEAMEKLSARLTDCTLYVTLEPCPMCAGALGWSQLSRIVYGASDEKRGFSKSAPSVLHPKTTVTSGVLAEECAKLMKVFFEKIR